MFFQMILTLGKINKTTIELGSFVNKGHPENKQLNKHQHTAMNKGKHHDKAKNKHPQMKLNLIIYPSSSSSPLSFLRSR